jgi:hypothetical protein
MGGDVQNSDDDLYLSVGLDVVGDVVSTLLADRRHRGVESLKVHDRHISTT